VLRCARETTKLTKLAAMAYVPIGPAPHACAAFFESELTKRGDVIKAASLKAQ
jgi:hypothetical protein